MLEDAAQRMEGYSGSKFCDIPCRRRNITCHFPIQALPQLQEQSPDAE